MTISKVYPFFSLRSVLYCCCALSLSLVTQIAFASPASEALSACLFKNSKQTDKTILVQWAYVSLAKTNAGKAVQSIPSDKIAKVEANAQKTLTNLVMKHCAKESMSVLFKDPKNGLQDTLQDLALKLVRQEVTKRSSPLLSITITDLLGK